MVDIFNDIIILYYEMDDIYSELYNLDLNGDRGNEIYLQLVNILKEKLQEEERLFKLLYDSEEYKDVYDYLMKEANPFFLRLLDYAKMFEDSDIKIDEEYDEETIRCIDEYKKLSKLCNACSRNLFLIYLSIFQEYIDSIDDEELKEKLLNLKYHNSFVNHVIENCFISCNFDVAEDNYVDLYLVADTLGLELKVCDDNILACYMSTIDIMITRLLSINDSDRDDIDKIAMLENTVCMLRACFALMSNNEYSKIENKVNDRINALENDSNSLSVELVKDIISNRDRDKKRVKKISIRCI